MTTTHAKNRGHRGQPWRVVGVVLRADGSPIAGAKVRVRRQGIRKTEDIARNPTAVTGADGRFVFEYAQPARRFDLRVELLPDRGLGIDATRPKLIAGAGQEEDGRFVFVYPLPHAGHGVAALAQEIDDAAGADEMGDADREEGLAAGELGLDARDPGAVAGVDQLFAGAGA